MNDPADVIAHASSKLDGPQYTQPEGNIDQGAVLGPGGLKQIEMGAKQQSHLKSEDTM